jgi:hypothetical protein
MVVVMSGIQLPGGEHSARAAGEGLVTVAAPKATDLYVAANGNDQAAGTEEAPFATLARAQAAIRAGRNVRRACH